jgi:molybdopterin-guanine dinucleotide biosynthesis protein A
MLHVISDLVLVLAADLPWIAPAVPRLLDALHTTPEAACAVLTADGRRNYLAAAWRCTALRDALAAVPDVHGAAARQLYRTVSVIDVSDEDGAGGDCDTWADIDAARSRADQPRR